MRPSLISSRVSANRSSTTLKGSISKSEIVSRWQNLSLNWGIIKIIVNCGSKTLKKYKTKSMWTTKVDSCRKRRALLAPKMVNILTRKNTNKPAPTNLFRREWRQMIDSCPWIDFRRKMVYDCPMWKKNKSSRVQDISICYETTGKIGKTCANQIVVLVL